ncbi:MAG TPA: hypothetical protein VNT52_10770, partial [Acidimicrobiales bacterium]|nr:hypothetical protein [Acidimicrobiales bacterium]
PAPEAGAGAGALREEMARLSQLVEDQRAEVDRLVTSLSVTQRGHAELAAACQVLEGRLAEAMAGPGADHVDKATVEDLVNTRLAETEARLTHLIAAQRGELEGAIERSVSAFTSGFLRANEDLAGGQAVLEERIEVIAGQVAQASSRLEILLDRLDVLEAAGTWAPPAPANADSPAAGGDLLDNLDRQLEAAARRLAARGQAGANRGQPEAPPVGGPFRG